MGDEIIFHHTPIFFFFFGWLENIVILNYNKCSKLTLTQKIEEPHALVYFWNSYLVNTNLIVN